jgi:protein gp37
MSDSSGIQWTDATWNPVVGCSPVSAGCANCYAVKMTHRLDAMERARGGGRPVNGTEGGRKAKTGEKYVGLTVLQGNGRRHFNGTVRTVPEALEVPLKWKKPRRIFVNSMSDLFHEKVPFEFIDRVFAVMALCPRHTFQVLTKRPERMAEYLAEFYPEGGRLDRMMDSAGFKEDPWFGRMEEDSGLWHSLATIDVLPNVWLGTSCENQAMADLRVPHLLKCPAAVRFLSCEPLLGAIDLRLGSKPDDLRTRAPYIKWVIVGGESGPNARPMDVAWARSIVGQCKDAGVPVFVKQLGARPVMGLGDRGEGERRELYPGGPVLVAACMECDFITSKKGDDPGEWPEDLRVREMPGVGVSEGRR